MSTNTSAEDVASTIIMAVLVLTVVATLAVGAALSAGAQEIGAVYSEHGQPGSPHRGVLLGALAGIGGVAVLLGLIAVVVPGALVACIVTGAWALLTFVAIVEGIDFAGRRQLKDGGNVASYLDFSSDAGERERVALP